MDLAVLGAVFVMFTTGLSFDIRNLRLSSRGRSDGRPQPRPPS